MYRLVILLATLFLAVIVTVPLNGLIEGNAAVESVAAEEADSNSPTKEEKERTDKHPPEFKQAGVCARCHVVSVLEWGISGHLEAETDCQECHGPSRAHVANERNEVKPDRLARGASIAKQSCSTCHETGCPKTLDVQNCQKCHHVHALINPSQPPVAKDERMEKLLLVWEQYRIQMAEGDRCVSQQDWDAAQSAFRAALKWIPGNHRARMLLMMCSRRLEPNLPGFNGGGERIDDRTGLPREVSVAGLDIDMLLVSPGEFDMGSDDLADSRPVHTVRLDPFYLGRYEVTQVEWNSVMGTNPSAHQGKDFPNAQRMPVERVSWNDCQTFLRRLNQRVPGGGFRLPTEAEWEYACRAATSGWRLDRPVSARGTRKILRQQSSNSSRAAPGQPAEEALSQDAWCRDNSLRQPTPGKPFLRVDAYAPRPVGTRRPNAWGFHDMQGNVCEWCSSLWQPYLYDATDGRESLTTNGKRILRGGGFADSVRSLDAALRHPERPHRRLRWNGLRLARSVPSPQPRNVRK